MRREDLPDDFDRASEDELTLMAALLRTAMSDKAFREFQKTITEMMEEDNHYALTFADVISVAKSAVFTAGTAKDVSKFNAIIETAKGIGKGES